MSTAKDNAARKKTAESRRKVAAEPRLSRLHRPDEMAVEDWQIRLRRQFGREQKFVLERLGSEPIFSAFLVGNPPDFAQAPVAA